MIDKNTQLLDGASVITEATNSDVFDFGSAADKAIGEPIYLDILFLQAFDNSANVAIKWQTDTVEAMSSATDDYTITVANAAAIAKKRLQIALPIGTKRYGRLVVTPSATPTTGKIFAHLTNAAEAWAPTTAN